ncbi:MAG: putative metal-dependent hydrolase [Halobacteriales archaeon]|jgi:predicted metal-dependent hydrolase
MRHELRAGIAIYNAGEYLAAHDAWEERWLELSDGPDKRFLQGLIQFTAAVHHARTRNWLGARKLADRAGEYLADLPDDYREVNVGHVRAFLARLAADPEVIDRRRPLRLRHGGQAVTPADLDFETTGVAASVLAEAADEYEEEVVERGVEYARETVEADGSDQFVGLVFDFVRDPENRSLIYRRLADHVDRRRRQETDVDGLFDSGE